MGLRGRSRRLDDSLLDGIEGDHDDVRRGLVDHGALEAVAALDTEAELLPDLLIPEGLTHDTFDLGNQTVEIGVQAEAALRSPVLKLLEFQEEPSQILGRLELQEGAQVTDTLVGNVLGREAVSDVVGEPHHELTADRIRLTMIGVFRDEAHAQDVRREAGTCQLVSGELTATCVEKGFSALDELGTNHLPILLGQSLGLDEAALEGLSGLRHLLGNIHLETDRMRGHKLPGLFELVFAGSGRHIEELDEMLCAPREGTSIETDADVLTEILQVLRDGLGTTAGECELHSALPHALRSEAVVLHRGKRRDEVASLDGRISDFAVLLENLGIEVGHVLLHRLLLFLDHGGGLERSEGQGDDLRDGTAHVLPPGRNSAERSMIEKK